MRLGGNGKSVIMDAALLIGDDPYRYPDNLPIVNATGGPGGKPSCGSLPDVSKNFPVKYLVTDTGFGTGLDVRPNPGIGFPGFANYFPVTKANPEPPRIRYPGGPAPGPCRLPRRTSYGAPDGRRSTRRRRAPPATVRTAAARDSHEGRTVARSRVALFTAVCLVFMFALVTVFGQFRFDARDHLQRGVHERVRAQGRELRPDRRCRGRQGQEPDPAQGRHRHGRLRHRQGADADRGHQGGGALREPDRRPLSVPRRRAGLGAETATGTDDPARTDLARPRRRRADRRLPAAVSRAGSRPGQRVVRRTAEGVPGPGRHHFVGAGPDLGADDDAGRARSAHRRGHHEPEHRAGHLRHA